MSQIDNRNSSAVKRARTDGGRREDDWTCPSCGNVNFSFRTTCNMRNCTQPRPADHNSKSAPRQMLTPQGQGYGYSSSSSSPYTNSGAAYMPYGSSALFNGASPYDVPLSSGGGGSGAYYNYNNRGLSGGAGYHRPMHLSAPSYPGAGGPMIGNNGMYAVPQLIDRYGLGFPMGPRPGFFPEETPQKKGDGTRENDWACPKCGNVNFSFRTVCNMRKCNTPKPGSQGGKSGKSSNMPEGSWKCEKCNNINYPFRTKCNRQNCDAEKPSESQNFPEEEEENDQ